MVQARAACVVLGHLFLSLSELELDEAQAWALERILGSVVGNGGRAVGTC